MNGGWWLVCSWSVGSVWNRYVVTFGGVTEILKLILSSGIGNRILRVNCSDLFWIVRPAEDWLFKPGK